MALINIDDNDPWIIEYDSCDRFYRNIMEKITLRDHETRMSQAYASLSANIRFQLKEYSDKVFQLRRKINDDLKTRNITFDEAERRKRQVEILENNIIKMTKLCDVRMNPSASERPSLIKSSTSAFVDGGTTGWGDDDDDDDPLLDVNVSVDNLKTHNNAALQDQERGLDELYKVIVRQKAIAQTINTEVDNQNEIIDDLADHMERLDDRLTDGTRTIKSITRKDSTCCYWVVIILLFISIIIVGLS